MCGIAGAFRLDGSDPPALPEHVLRSMTELIDYRGPGRRRLRVRRRAARSARAGSRSSTSRAATSRSPNERGRVWGAQNGEIYNHDDLRDGLQRARARAAQPLRHRGPPAPLRGARARPGRAPARHVRRRRLGPGRAPRRADPRPPRHQAAVLRDRRRRRRLRLRAQVRDRQRPRQRRARPRGDLRLPHARLRPGRDDAAQAGPQARARRAPGRPRRQRDRRALVALPGARPRSRRRARPRSGPRSCSTSSTSRSSCA